MSTHTKQDRFVAFPAHIWEKAQSKEELAAWLMTASQEEEMPPVGVVKDYLTLPNGDIPIELHLSPNGDILALLLNTDLAADGNNFEEAKQNLLLAIKDDYGYLSQRRDALGQELLDQLKFLEEKLA
ncbi:hypothetical protein HYR99_28170 [Candidatus Poribacteria bacterium]|nr:hypothetical protein [Candidatus Poribacteria bacterium]